MNTYIIRPYYAYDCNSVEGFNNGCYLDEIEVEADSEDYAIELCIQKQKTALPKNTEYLDNIMDDVGVVWVTKYCEEEDEEGNREYLYKYIDFGDVKLKE
jgi:hypothetical protein